jgi:AcrR family transcriptional regulator
MPSKAKQKRPYNAARRQAQAAETRRHIVAAAHQLFAERGYAGTTMQAIADEAGVAVETVYAALGSKRAILARLVDVSVGGDEQPVPILERPGPQAVRQEPDQRRQIRLFASDMRQIMERASPIFEIMRLAAKSEPDIAALLQSRLDARLRNLSRFVEWLARNGPLRPGLSRPEASETVWALTSPDLHRLLTVDRGWPGDRYEQWLGDSLIAVLLPCAARRE